MERIAANSSIFSVKSRSSFRVVVIQFIDDIKHRFFSRGYLIRRFICDNEGEFLPLDLMFYRALVGLYFGPSTAYVPDISGFLKHPVPEH